jgi:hypothetical protein
LSGVVRGGIGEEEA